ncbi:hypothetical protein GVN21_03300 [Caulobacter sp. SLTY]|uniref:hypothetical protein n=1 Tax=Caulobacter sp. SLTY TaxID=2683262 RepID=UPI001411C7D8|nr:hypothetical protein [Caulobacter sp. SLTY]NBB14382.1 hypothetical protein [Caulobacter sp. SLTY]
MTLYDHLYGPPRWTRWLDIAGWLVGLWLVTFPVPYLPLLTVTALLPPLAAALVAIWPRIFTLTFQGSTSYASTEERWSSLGGFWFTTGIAITARAMMDLEMIDYLWPILAGLAGGVAMTLVFALVERDFRGWWLVICLPSCIGWAWGGLLFTNAWLDRTPGQFIVIEDLRGVDDIRPGYTVRSADGRPLADQRLARTLKRTFGRPLVHRCLDVNTGLFGWRSVMAVNCNAPLQSLAPPAPPAPSRSR